MTTKEFDIDLGKSNSYIEGMDELGVISREMRKQGFYNKNCLYTGMDTQGIDSLRRGQNYRFEEGLIYAFDKKNLKWESDISERGLEDYCSEIDSFIAVWDRRKFREGDLRYSYIFKKGENISSSLIAIAKLI